MPAAIVTVRELRNKSTGIDLSIPTVQGVSSLLTSTFQYNIVVVSNLHYFKLPHHKDTDVVQFVISKRFDDFETLRKNLTEEFPGTIIPQLPKSLLSFFDKNVAEKKTDLESFLNFVASTPRIATSYVTLEFLGVNPVTAGRYTSGETDENAIRRTGRDQHQQQHDDTSTDMFVHHDAENQDDDIFTAPSSDRISKSYERTKLFEDLSLNDAEGLNDNGVKRSLHPGISIQRPTSIEDISNLLAIDDESVNQLLKPPKPRTNRKLSLDLSPRTAKKTMNIKKKPDVKSKPPKPNHSEAKPKSPRSSSAPADAITKPTPPPKPAAIKAPSGGVKAPSSGDKQQQVKKTTKEAFVKTDEMKAEDILSYIHENTVDESKEPELFS